jgi:hypothetical protein
VLTILRLGTNDRAIPPFGAGRRDCRRKDAPKVLGHSEYLGKLLGRRLKASTSSLSKPQVLACVTAGLTAGRTPAAPRLSSLAFVVPSPVRIALDLDVVGLQRIHGQYLRGRESRPVSP